MVGRTVGPGIPLPSARLHRHEFLDHPGAASHDAPGADHRPHDDGVGFDDAAAQHDRVLQAGARRHVRPRLDQVEHRGPALGERVAQGVGSPLAEVVDNLRDIVKTKR